MTSSLTRFDQTKVVQGSMRDVAARTGQSLAQVLMGAKKLALVDVSSSMLAQDAKGGAMTRHDAAAFELEQVQNRYPGAVAVFSFSDETHACPSGVPIRENGGTNLAGGLEFIKTYDGVLDVIVISDGSPDNPSRALEIASTFVSKIDTIFVGPDDDREGGRVFLAQLAAAGKGQAVTSANASDLGDKFERLMLAAGR